ncbi:MAG: hypothetical protein NZ750_08795 [Anaerolineae bacterium]|nr:hypothetical protein [Anaerolineae bacterium]MDW8172467.1 hypothetical protein [Anaerolineae bacterium]
MPNEQDSSAKSARSKTRAGGDKPKTSAKGKPVSIASARKPRTWRDNALLGIGILIISSMGLSLVAPFLQSAAPAPTAPATEPPTPTPLPTPIADLNSITFENRLLHPSGLFSVGQPKGWTPFTSQSTPQEVQITLRNDAALSVVEYRMVRPETPPSSGSDVSAFFTSSWLAASWRDYTRWTEETRQVQGNDLVMDFSLERGAQRFIARQLAFTDGTYIYGVRVVAPPNAADMVRYIVENARSTFEVNNQFADIPLEWKGYYDASYGHLLRYPSSWTLDDFAEGAPASFSADGGITLRLEAQSAPQVSDESQARAFVEAAISGARIRSVQTREQFGKPAYFVSYSAQTVDGDPISGLALLIPDENRVHLANLRLTGQDVDLNESSSDTTINRARQVVETLALLQIDATVVR